METKQVLQKLIDKQHLLPSETEAFFSSVLEGNIDPVQIAAIITALRMKGETGEEILGFIQAMRRHMIPIKAKGAVDVCGTGGDGKHTFNISTAVSFVVAACGVSVAKHGSRAASSSSGSADVLEALGVNIALAPAQAEKVLEKTGIVFLFAPLYHPAMKHVAGIRQSLGIRTVFNLLGPFSNPASVTRQLIGVPDKQIAKTLAKTAVHLGYEHVILASSDDGLDEISIFSPTTIYDIQGEKIRRTRFTPAVYNLTEGNFSDIIGGDAQENADIIHKIFAGEKGPRRNIVIINSAFALLAAGKIKHITQGIRLAEEAIDAGKASYKLEQLKESKYA